MVLCACAPGVARVGDEGAGREEAVASLFSTSTEPVFMTGYWPTRALSRLYRVPSGRIYYKQVIEPVDPRAGEAGSVLTARAGTEAYLLHDYFDHDGTNVDARFWGDTWHLRNTPSTGEVSEVADTFPQRNASDTADLSTCTAPCYGRIAIYNGQVIGHGRPGGHRVGEVYAQHDIRWWYSASGAAPYTALEPEYGSWSELTLLEKLDSYTPPYGRDARGFGKGRSRSYERVVKVLFAHGNRVPAAQEPRCTNQPAAFPHRPGASSFWQVLWLAPDVGIIQFENLFYEPRCDGSVLHPAQGVDGDWFAYLDVLQELGAAPPGGCVARPDEVVVNTCASVGYPAHYVGSYTSRRSWSCVTNAWGEWRREDTCAAPTCTPQADQVVVNTCASVGYPAHYVGSYVSRRSWSCAANDWSAWVREDTCAAPTCTPQADQVVVNTCASVGYPAHYVGSYVSRRSWSCAANDWGAWVREDTCAPP
jgi:hypothetical protein